MKKSLRFLLLCMFVMALVVSATAETNDPIQYLTDLKNLPQLCQEDLLEVHFIEVAAADCILLRMGNHSMLVDSGRHGTADKVVSYLRSIGVDSLDCVFLTHPHDDHLGGFPGILNEIPTSALYRSYLYEQFESPRQNMLARTLRELQIPEYFVTNETRMQFGNATLTFYQWQNPNAHQNNRSMIIKIQYGSRTMLLSADLENNGQKKLAAEYGESLRADIIKMPHHGIGKYEITFHDAVKPLFGIVTNTKKSAQETIDTMVRRGMKWMVTTRGTVVAVCDGNQWRVWQLPKAS